LAQMERLKMHVRFACLVGGLSRRGLLLGEEDAGRDGKGSAG
jgi:hypothetical protein